MKDYGVRRPVRRVLYWGTMKETSKMARIVRVLEDLSNSEFEKYRLCIPVEGDFYECLYEVKIDSEGNRKKVVDKNGNEEYVDGVLRTLDGKLTTSVTQIKTWYDRKKKEKEKAEKKEEKIRKKSSLKNKK